MVNCSEIIVDPEIMGGSPVFKGTRVTLDSLMDYLETGSSIEEFVSDFPTVRIQQVNAVIASLRNALVA
jgi:uncharacterized protein (DUF433 family)